MGTIYISRLPCEVGGFCLEGGASPPIAPANHGFFPPGLEGLGPLGQHVSMLLFKRLMDFPRAALSRLGNKRRSARCPVAPGFPLKASISLSGAPEPTTGKRDSRSGIRWGGAVLDLSSGGLSLRLPAAATTTRGEPSVLTLSLEDFELHVPCTVAHFRTHASGAWCGLALAFDDDTQRKGYLQLLEAVVLGAEFSFDKAPKDSSGLYCERYRSGGKRAVLTVWRTEKGGDLYGFELSVGEHCVRGDMARSTLQACASDEERTPLPAGPERSEVIRLYRILTANLPKALPADLRAAMASLGRPEISAPRR